MSLYDNYMNIDRLLRLYNKTQLQNCTIAINANFCKCGEYGFSKFSSISRSSRGQEQSLVN